MTVLAELDVDVLHVIAELSELLNLLAHVFFQAFGDLDIAAVDVDFHDHSSRLGAYTASGWTRYGGSTSMPFPCLYSSTKHVSYHQI